MSSLSEKGRMICHNCKRDYEEFKIDNGDTGYWFCVPKGTDDLSYLFSDGSFGFLACCDKEPDETEKYDYWCVRCIDACAKD